MAIRPVRFHLSQPDEASMDILSAGALMRDDPYGQPKGRGVVQEVQLDELTSLAGRLRGELE